MAEARFSLIGETVKTLAASGGLNLVFTSSITPLPSSYYSYCYSHPSKIELERLPLTLLPFFYADL